MRVTSLNLRLRIAERANEGAVFGSPTRSPKGPLQLFQLRFPIALSSAQLLWILQAIRDILSTTPCSHKGNNFMPLIFCPSSHCSIISHISSVLLRLRSQRPLPQFKDHINELETKENPSPPCSSNIYRSVEKKSRIQSGYRIAAGFLL